MNVRSSLLCPPSPPREDVERHEGDRLPRRTILLRAAQGFGVAALAVAAGAPDTRRALAQAEPGDRRTIATVATVRRLAEVEPRERLAYAEGLNAPEDGGGGLFVWHESTDDAVANDGFVHVAGPAGTHGAWTRLDYDGAAVRPEWFGSIPHAFDHAPIIQRAIDHVSAAGRGRVELGSGRYRCLSAIEMDPTLCALSASAAVLDFSEREDVEGASGSEVLLTDLLAAAAGPWSGEGGVLRRRGYAPETLSVTRDLAAGERCRVEVDLRSLEGDPNIPFLRVEILRAGDEKPFSELVLSSAARLAFEFEAPGGPCNIVLSSNSDVDIAGFRLTATGRRECLLIRCRESGTQYGHTWIEGLRIYGPGRSGRANELEGIRFETAIESRASRLSMRDVIVEGFGTAVVMSHRCYLAQFTSCRFVGQVGVHFLAGTSDAGENISFFGSVVGGGQIGIWNGGAELNLFGCSVNFCDQFYVGVGKLHASGCHFETNRTLRSDQYLFDVGKGLVNVDGGTILVSGRGFEEGNQADHIVMCRSRLAEFSLARAACYNLRTRTNVFGGGPGVVRLREIGGDARKFVAPIPKRDLATNLFGPASRFDAGSTLPVRLVTSTGDLEPATIEPGEEEGVLSLARTEASPDLWCWLLARCLPGMRVAWSLDIRYVPAPAGEAEARPQGGLLLDILYCQIDAAAHPGRVPGAFVVAKRPVSLAFDEIEDWRSFVGSTHDTREDEWGDGSAPAFATHVAMRLNLTDLDRGARLLLRSPYAGAV